MAKKKLPVITTGDMSFEEIVNKTIFQGGKDLKYLDPAEGVSKHLIFSKDSGNIPGIIHKHWDIEVAKRVEEIHEAKGNNNFFTHATALLLGRKDNTRVDGTELSKYSPAGSKNSAKINVYLKRLSQDPADAIARMNLAVIIADPERMFKKEGREITVEVHRTAFLQATASCLLGEYNLKQLFAALTLQHNYLEQLKLKCRNDVKKLEAFAASHSSVPEFKKKVDRLIVMIRRNQSIVSELQSQSNPLHLKHQSNLDFVVSLREISDFLLRDEKKAQDAEKIRHILGGSVRIVNVMKSMPLMYKKAHELTDALMKLDAGSPIPAFLKARIEKNCLVFANSRFTSGERTKEVLELAKKHFKTAYNYYGQARKIIGNMPSQNDCTVLFEYAQVAYLFYQIAPMLDIQLPKVWVKTVFQNSQKALELVVAADTKITGVIELQRNIAKALEKEG
ncbi:hypothetical protein WDW89_00205 [Deltaproteobacteria bacterium TL4]